MRLCWAGGRRHVWASRMMRIIIDNNGSWLKTHMGPESEFAADARGHVREGPPFFPMCRGLWAADPRGRPADLGLYGAGMRVSLVRAAVPRPRTHGPRARSSRPCSLICWNVPVETIVPGTPRGRRRAPLAPRTGPRATRKVYISKISSKHDRCVFFLFQFRSYLTYSLLRRPPIPWTGQDRPREQAFLLPEEHVLAKPEPKQAAYWSWRRGAARIDGRRGGHASDGAAVARRPGRGPAAECEAPGPRGGQQRCGAKRRRGGLWQQQQQQQRGRGGKWGKPRLAGGSSGGGGGLCRGRPEPTLPGALLFRPQCHGGPPPGPPARPGPRSWQGTRRRAGRRGSGGRWRQRG